MPAVVARAHSRRRHHRWLCAGAIRRRRESFARGRRLVLPARLPGSRRASEVPQVTVKQLKDLIEDWPSNAPVTVRTVEHGEVCLTVTLTSVDQYEDGSLMLVGDVDKASN